MTAVHCQHHSAYVRAWVRGQVRRMRDARHLLPYKSLWRRRGATFPSGDRAKVFSPPRTPPGSPSDYSSSSAPSTTGEYGRWQSCLGCILRRERGSMPARTVRRRSAVSSTRSDTSLSTPPPNPIAAHPALRISSGSEYTSRVLTPATPSSVIAFSPSRKVWPERVKTRETLHVLTWPQRRFATT